MTPTQPTHGHPEEPETVARKVRFAAANELFANIVWWPVVLRTRCALYSALSLGMGEPRFAVELLGSLNSGFRERSGQIDHPSPRYTEESEGTWTDGRHAVVWGGDSGGLR